MTLSDYQEIEALPVPADLADEEAEIVQEAACLMLNGLSVDEAHKAAIEKYRGFLTPAA